MARTAPILVAAALVALGVGCSASDDGSDSSSTTAGASSPAASADVEAVVPAGCAWRVRADEATLNIAYPDTAATYWATGYELGEGDRLRVDGTFPDARYASFITYGADGSAIDTVTDRDLDTTSGTNPFVIGADADESGAYRVVATTDEGATADPAELRTAETGTIIYRVYLGAPAGDPTGGAGLPALAVAHPDGSETAIPTCEEPGASDTALDIVNKVGPPTDRAAPPTPIFLRPADNGAGLFPNPDNVYVATILAHEPGRVVVVRGQAPTFADTGMGGAEATPSGDEQVRYWSICTNEYRKPYPVSSCLVDRDIPLDDEGRFTIAVSTAEDRPANATEADGVAWLDWGSTEVDVLLLVRHLLAAPGFAESATNVEPGALAASSMGAYAPAGAICTTEAFEAGGADACP